MADYALEAQPRTITGKKVRQLRNQGLVPIVIYGPKTEPIHLQVPYRQLEVMLMKAGGTNLIDINVQGQAQQTVIAREIQRDILKGTILHADFFAVDEDSPIAADVNIVFVGESPIVATREGMMLPGTTNLTVESLPRHLPNQIEVDLSGLTEIGMSITVRDLDMGENVRILNDPDEMIIRIAQPAAARAAESEEAEDESGTEQTSSEVEVIGRGKRDEEEDE